MTQTKLICSWRRPLASLGLGLSLSILPTFTRAEDIVSLRRTACVRAIQQAEPAVVNIEGNKPGTSASGSRSDSLVNGMGAGVIIDDRGYILTNQHVVQDVGRIEVTLHSGKKYYGRLIARDSATDLALVKVDAQQPLPTIRCGTSSDLMLGEPVIAIGNPFGYHHTVTEGIVSALHRDIPVNGVQDYPDLIQTDASINPGNSGGPLLNIEGDMIGINAAVRIGAQGIGFAIPVDRATEVAASMIARSRRGPSEGAVNVKTEYRAGESRLRVVSSGDKDLKRGDVIAAIGSRPISNRLDYELAMLGHAPGSEVSIQLERNGQPIVSKLRLDSRPLTRAKLASSNPTRDRVFSKLGLRLEPANAATVRKVDASYKGGLRVTSVREGSPADRAQIQPGDVLVGLLEWQTPDWQDLAWILNSSDMRTASRPKFHIMRGSDVFWGTLEIAASKAR